MRLYLLLVGVLLSFQSTFATETDEGPFAIPMANKGVDTELTGNSPREFFKKRMDNPACRTKLTASRTAYLAAKKLLDEAKAKFPSKEEVEKLAPEPKKALQGPIEKLEQDALSARVAWVNLFSECGNCTSREPEPIITDDEAWYASYGSCQLSEEDKGKLKGYFEKWRDTLLHQKQYAHRDGGFFHILDLKLNDLTGVPFPKEYDVIGESPAEGALSVRGPKILTLSTGFTYYTKQIFETTGADGSREFSMQGWPVKALPEKFKFPSIVDNLASHREVKLAQRKLSRVISQWYANEDGYVSYFTAGDFGKELSAVKTQSRVIMRDTIANMVERVEAEPK